MLLCLACLTWLAAGAAHAQDDTPAEPAVTIVANDSGEHQLLVMLRLPAAHYRPDASYGGRYLDDSGRSARHRRAEQLAQQHGLALLDDWPMPVLGIDCYVMRYPAHESAEHMIAVLTQDPQVAWAQPVASFSGLGQADTAPAGDALYPVQPAARYWHVAELHRYTTGRNIKVAVVDSGIDASHPDLLGQLDVNSNFVDAGPTPAENHGTAVAGIIAAKAGNGGILGVAPQARLMGLRACWQLPDQATRCNSFTLAKAINYAILNGARVINLSLSGPPDRLLDRLLDAALERGIGVVGAVDPQNAGPAFPAGHRGVLAVASQTRNGSSNRAVGQTRPEPPLFAPGNDIPTSAPGGRWTFVNGSSYAAAHVSGMLALLDELQPDTSPAQLRQLLQPAPTLNAGNIDACATISRLVRHCQCTLPLSQSGAAP
nr:S8 family serine peptidase [Duganella levis]